MLAEFILDFNHFIEKMNHNKHITDLTPHSPPALKDAKNTSNN